MIQKTVSISPPLDDNKAIQIERMFSSLFTNALQARTGTYTGDGKSGKVVSIGIKILFILIYRNVAGSFSGVFGIRDAAVCYIPGTGTVTDAITSYGVNDITLGNNVSVNASGVTYTYFAVG